MEAIAEGLWGLADHHERNGEISKTIKCLESICQSTITFFPIIEVKTRVRISTLLLKHTHNLTHAKSHLQRSLLLLNSIPSNTHLKCTAYSLLAHCYFLHGSIVPLKNLLHKAIDLTTTTATSSDCDLWTCNFTSQLANAFVTEGDYASSLATLETGFVYASRIPYAELQLFFATSILHVNLMQWHDPTAAENAVNKCDEVWNSIHQSKREGECLGLLFYNELLHVFYRLRICDYKNAAPHVDRLDAAMKAGMLKMQEKQQITNELDTVNKNLSRPNLPSRERTTLSSRYTRLQERLQSIDPSTSNGRESLEAAYFGNTKRALTDKLVLAPPPIDGEWLPKSAVYALVDLMVIVLGRPKGQFRDCTKRFHTGVNLIKAELERFGIIDGVKETDLRHSTIWMTGVYLMLLMHFYQNKVAVELTRSEFAEAQGALVQMRNWFLRFPTILQSCESMIEMLRGLYANSVGCYNEAAFHYIESAKLTESKSAQTLCQVYASVSYLCIGDPASSAQALDLIGPVYSMKDSVGGVREEASILFAYGLLLMRQQEIQDARNKLAIGLQIAHNHMGNLQLVSQYLTSLGSLALALHDTVQAREILRSSLTLAKKLCDIPTQIWVLSLLSALYQQLGDKGNEMENDEYRSKKIDELQRKLADARSSIHHIELQIERSRFQVEQQYNDIVAMRALEDQSMRVNLDIPESVGISGPQPNPSSSKLVELDTTRRRSKRLSFVN
ncbi:hypothetical protein ACFE04_013243 [Oxalis oulophora]